MSDAQSSEKENTQIQDTSLAKTEKECIRSIMLDPESSTRWNALALVYMITGKTKLAEEAIKNSLELNTSNAMTWRIWGDLLMGIGQNIESERIYRMSLELDPTQIVTMHRLVQLLIKRKAYPEAMEVLERLVVLSPNDQKVWDAYSICIGNMIQ
ncbi:MAG: tetratricopeptide repeat protein [Candidatus Thorarchaeota archaeon]|jgi:Tfp pilus assembly protein PilF